MAPPSTSAKVAIPPLRHRAHTPPVTTDKKRTAKACAECRSRKIKCSGRQPTCDHCDQLQLPCVYNDGKRERHKKGLERGDRMLQLLRDISATVHLPSDIRSRIKSLELEVPDDNLSMASTASQKRFLTVGVSVSNKRPRSHSPSMGRVENPEAMVSAEVGSQRSVDLVGEDLVQTEQTRATGFIGKVSEVAWAQSLAHVQNSQTKDECDGSQVFGTAGDGERAQKDRLEAMGRRHAPEYRPQDRVSDYNYHADQEDVLLLSNVDKDELPTAEMATNICECYMKNVQGMFPALSKSDFMNQFEIYLGSRNPENLPAKWRAILNLVFAIGARFSHLAEAPWRGDERDHLIYFTRARHLGFNGETLLEHPDIQGIQVLALISFYYLAIGQASRAWVMVGSACRHAVALGMHLRTEVPSIPTVQKEKRVCVWWSLHRLDHVLCEITGRPPAINHLFASVPVPTPLERDNVSPALDRMSLDGRERKEGRHPKDGMHIKDSEMDDVQMTICFRHHVLLGLIAQKAIVKLYSAATVTESWEAARDSIVALSKEIDQWYSNLPPKYQFYHNSTPATLRERTLLGFSFYSTKILLNRPCLCRIDVRMKNIGEHSKVVNDERSRECVRAARSMADLLPDGAEPDVLWLYCNGPWWCIVHHLMQAITVFMLELAFELNHMSEPKADRDAILAVLQKLIRWMEKMADMGNATARGAYKQIREQFRGFESSRDSKIHEFAGMVFTKQARQSDVESPLATPRPSTWQSQAAGDVELDGDDGQQQDYAETSESADYFGQLHRDQHGVSLNQSMQTHQTVKHQHHHHQNHYHLDDVWRHAAPPAAAFNLPLNAATTTPFGAGPGEPWETNPDPTWSNLIWQTSHDQFNPFSHLAPGWPLLAPQQLQQMDGAALQHSQYAAGVYVGAGQTHMSAFARVPWVPSSTQQNHHHHRHHQHQHQQPHHQQQQQHRQNQHIPHPDQQQQHQHHQLSYNDFADGDMDCPYDASSSMDPSNSHSHSLADGYEAAAALEHVQGVERERDGLDGVERHLN
ncbi:fungal-specific transcription factor domain-containing protein [Phyllosticta citriasiana]|uniref:fungal-specific transcription factor domain-containing protein n=1 Tax=Phyllosticta citriasiana TaxID=595635 RepID=UPI0030FD6F55